MYCRSDLCWDCDSSVHAANFLVAKHSRNLLCRSCQSPTPWNASGPRLAPIVSACEKCVVDRKAREDDRGDSTLSSYGEGEGGDDGNGEGRAAADGDRDEENQVVPSRSSLAAPPPVVSSPSSSEDSRASGSSAMANFGKRPREEPELCSARNLHRIIPDGVHYLTNFTGSTSNWKRYRMLIK
ncbi:hypothetical protein BT93_E2450 [Corymbia citriodora subsp. variegata]|nr:hypothetical protein BT93_E2450 [Corymbia citriodora subsp. variegata]